MLRNGCVNCACLESNVASLGPRLYVGDAKARVHGPGRATAQSVINLSVSRTRPNHALQRYANFFLTVDSFSSLT
jgi:hypothetical protein